MVLELKLELSDALAQEAKSKGLLESPAVERMLRAELKKNAAAWINSSPPPTVWLDKISHR